MPATNKQAPKSQSSKSVADAAADLFRASWKTAKSSLDLKSYSVKLLGHLAALGVGAIVGQTVLPQIVPRIELLSYQYLGLHFGSPLYLVIASKRSVETQHATGDDQIGIYRIFCGWSSNSLRYCVMRLVKNNDPAYKGTTLDRLPLLSPSYDVIEGRTEEAENISWVSLSGSNKGGYLTASDEWQSAVGTLASDHSGYGLACISEERESPQKNSRQELFYGYVGTLDSLRKEKTILDANGVGSPVEQLILQRLKDTPTIGWSNASAKKCGTNG